VFAKKGSQQVYNTIPKSREWMIVNYAINAAGGVLPSFYIFKGERIGKDYIQQCKLKSCMAMQKKNMDDMLFVQTIFLFIYSISTRRSISTK
jgi:hypothetical protein